MELPPATAHDARPTEIRLDLDGAPGCIAAAREAALSFLRHHAPPGPLTLHDDVVLVVSELVTNAVRHAPGPLVLELALVPGGIGIAVRDTSSRLPHARTPDLTGGRGWRIIQSLARQVSVVPLRDGKTVRVELAG
ncbi:ATP-binding protein [Streptomyces sp. NPDC054961]